MIVRELLAVFGVKYDETGAQKAVSGLEALAGKAQQLGKIVAGSAALWGIKHYIEQASNYAEAIGVTSERLRMQAETLQELSYAAEAAGVQHEILENAMLNFSLSAAEAARNGGDLAVAAYRLGVRLTDSVGRVKKPTELLAQLADGFHRLKSETEKARLAQILFGQEGLKLLSLLEKGSGNLKAMAKEAKQLGLVMSNESIAAGEKLMEFGRRALYVFRALGYGIAEQLLPRIQRITDALEAVVKGITIAAQGTNLFKTSAALLTGVLNGLALVMAYKLAPSIATAVIAATPFIATMAAWVLGIAAVVLIFEDLVTLLSGGDSLIGRFGNAISKMFSSAVKSMKGMFADFGEWLLGHLHGIVAKVTASFTDMMPDFLKPGTNSLDKKVGAAVKSMVLEPLRGLDVTVANAFHDLFPDALASGAAGAGAGGSQASGMPLLRGPQSSNARGFGPLGVASVLRPSSSSLSSGSHHSNQPTIHAPVNQSVKVDVNVSSGADPKEIGAQVSRAVSVELDKDRRNAMEALRQTAARK